MRFRIVRILSLYSDLAQKCGLDSLLKSSNSVTVFIPPAEALETFNDSDIVAVRQLLSYTIIPTLFLTRNVDDFYNLSTLTGKFALIEHSDNSYFFDGKEIIYQSALYKNGIYYKLKDLAFPKLSIYEYLQKNNPVFAEYIDSQDSVFLSDSLSKAIGFNSEGQTIYKDSVLLSVNRFERDYFPVSKDFRNRTATLVIPSLQQYNDALALVTNSIGIPTVPVKWQEQVLIPYLMDRGMFEGRLDSLEFLKKKLRNIRGDTIEIDYQPVNRQLCSNGFVYSYSSYTLPDSLFMGNIRIQGEDLIDSIGNSVYAWKDDVVVTGDKRVKPQKNIVSYASKGYTLSAQFPDDFTGQYVIQFPVKNVFPRTYQLIWRGTFNPGANFAIYINDVKVREFDLYSIFNKFIASVATSDYYYKDTHGYNQFDALVQNITEFGDITIKIEYLDAGTPPGGINVSQGLNMDYLELVPITN